MSLSSMIEALGLEVAAIRRRGGSTRIELRGGTRLSRLDRHFLYRFPLSEEVRLRDDTPVRVILNDRELDGILVSVSDEALVVAIDEDVGPSIPHCRLIADDSFLIERLKEKLQEVDAGVARFHRASADRVIGQRSIRTGVAEPHEATRLGQPLDGEKWDAVRLALGSEAVFVWGPPGTGKTTTVARIVEALYRKAKSVLLVSNTNIAVDTALEMIARRLEDDPAFREGAVLRYGPVAKAELEAQYGQRVMFEEVVKHRSEDLRGRIERLQQERAPLADIAVALQRTIEGHRQLSRARSDLAEARSDHAVLHQKRQALGAQITELEARLKRARSDLDRARSMGALRRAFSGLNPDRLNQQIAMVSGELGAARDAERATRREIEESSARIEELTGRVAALDQRLAGQLAPAECQRRKTEVDRQIKEIDRRLAELQAQVNALRERILNACRILATTVYRTYLKGQVDRDWDVVVIDEASMLMLPMSYYAAGLARETVVVAGDFRQLPPIVLSDDALAREWLKRDVFEAAGIPQMLDQDRPPPYLATLRVQHRMRAPICALLNDLFYDDLLVTSDTVRQRPPVHSPLASKHLVYVDTAELYPWAAMPLGTYSRYNLIHALLVRSLVGLLESHGQHFAGREGCGSLGIVAPYAGQARLIQRLVEERRARRETAVAATVHRFQGNEKSAMIVDLTDSYGTHVGRFIRAIEKGEEGARLLNVALSRAKDQVMLVANFGFIYQKVPRSVTRRVLDYFREHGEALDAREVLRMDRIDWVNALGHLGTTAVELPDDGAAIFTEGTFYPAFAADLSRARETIFIFSPFVSSRGVARWVEHLRAAVQRGVRVCVVSRPLDGQPGVLAEGADDLFTNLRRLGIRVDLRARMHEKVAVIDGRILWHGSLNVLSHNDTSELMARIASPAICDQFLRFLSPAASRGVEDWASAGNPTCSECGGYTICKTGRYGVFFQCERCGKTMDTRRPRRQTDGRPDRRRPGPGRQPQKTRSRTARVVVKDCSSPGCTGSLVEKKGRYGSFLGCTNYPTCRYTENL